MAIYRRQREIKTIRSILLILILLLFITVQISVSQNKVCVFFFYGVGCSACERVSPFISMLEQKYSQLRVYWFEVYGNRENLKLLNGLFERYGVGEENRKIPAVFVDNVCLVGEEQIRSELEDLFQHLLQSGCPCPVLEEKEALTTLSLLAVTSAALADSVNPCAVGALIFLFSLLSRSGDRNRLARVGLSFTASIYLSYFLFGFGLLSTIQVVGLSYGFYMSAGALAIMVGLLNVKDSIRPGCLGFSTELPKSLKKLLASLLATVTSPAGAFTTGFAVCLIELPCTGGPYLYILGLLAQKSTRASAIPLLLYYNLLYILPLAIITLLISLGISSIPKMAHWRHRNARLIRLALGTIMITLGATTILEVI